MKESVIPVERLSQRLLPQPERVIPRFFAPGDENRIRGLAGRVRGLTKDEVRELLQGVQDSFESKHPDVRAAAAAAAKKLEAIQ